MQQPAALPSAATTYPRIGPGLLFDQMSASSGRVVIVLQIGVVLALTELLLLLVPVRDAVAGGVVHKLLFLLRMPLLLLVATVFLRRRGASWADVGLRRPARLWVMLVAAIVGPAVVMAAGIASKYLMLALGLSMPRLAVFQPLQGNLPEYLYWGFVVAWTSAAFGEEMLFRGFLMNSIAAALGGSHRRSTLLAAATIQAILFGTLHLYQGLGGAIVDGFVGFVLALIWLVSGRNLWAGIVAHGLIDCLGMTAIYLGGVTA